MQENYVNERYEATFVHLAWSFCYASNYMNTVKLGYNNHGYN
jgi:hypothetical protein